MTMANGSWLNSERIRRVAGICALGSLCLLLWLLITSRGTLDWLGRPLGTDFSNVWAAGRMALNGQAVDAWNWARHFAVQRAIHGPALTEVYAWHYPPPFLLVAAILGSLPYLSALIVWQLVTFIPFILMMQRLVPGRESMLLTLAAPVTLICLAHGQNGFLTAGLLAGGLLLLDRKALPAGLLFGCLIYKPQFGLIIPVMLLAGRQWRAIGGAFLSAATLIAATLVIWGYPVWQAFIDSLPLTRSAIVEQGAAGFYKNMSSFAAIRMWGGSLQVAYAVQFVLTALTIPAVFFASREPASRNLRNPIVCAATILATPYALDYDLVVLLPALAWLYLDGREHGFLRWDASIMAGVWIAPLFARAAAEFLYIPLGLISVLAVAGLALRRLLSRNSMPIGDVYPRGKHQVRQP